MDSIPITTAAATIDAIQASSVDDFVPDFDAYVREKMNRATSIVAKPIESIFTLALILSITTMPFIILRALAPALVISLMSSAWAFAAIPYVIFMVVVGLKVASLFGCGAWNRITSVFRD